MSDQDFLTPARSMGGYDGEPSGWAKFESLRTNYTGVVVSCRWAPNLKYKSTETDPENPKMIVVEIALVQPTINPLDGQVLNGQLKRENNLLLYPFVPGARVSLTYKPKSQAMAAFADALTAVNLLAPQVGGMWSDTFSGERPSDKGNPQKLHTVVHTPTGANMLADAQAMAPNGYEPAPTNGYVPVAPQPQPVYANQAPQPAYAPQQPVYPPQPQAPQPVYAQPQPIYANQAPQPVYANQAPQAPQPVYPPQPQAPQQPVYGEQRPSMYEPPPSNPQYGQPIYQPPQQPVQGSFPVAVDPQAGGHDQSFANQQAAPPAPVQQLQTIAQPGVGVASPPWANGPTPMAPVPNQNFAPAPAAA